MNPADYAAGVTDERIGIIRLVVPSRHLPAFHKDTTFTYLTYLTAALYDTES
jgi:hypothetical protein